MDIIIPVILSANLRLLDCIIRPKQLIDTAIEMGLSGIAITDHESLSAHMIVNKYAKELRETHPDFTIALGNEIYLTETRTPKQKYYHFILIAKDRIGYEALCKLSSIAWYQVYKTGKMERVPTLKKELEYIMKDYKGHVIATTACFRKGSLVETQEGLKPIETITSDDYILNLNGEWEQVNFPTSRKYRGQGCKITFLENTTPTYCTEDHQFLVTTNNKLQKYLKGSKKDPCEWVSAKELNLERGASKHICLYPISQVEYSYNTILYKKEWKNSLRSDNYQTKVVLPEEIVITPELMQLFGLWLGDGSISINLDKNYYAINFNFSIEEFDYYYENFFKQASQQLGINWSINRRPEIHKVDLSSHSVELVELFYYLFGCSHADSKYIPKRLLHLSPELDFNLFFGYSLADGYFRTRQKDSYEYGEMVASSISRTLIEDIQQLLKTLGIRSSITINKNYIDKDGTNHKTSYSLSSSNKAWVLVNKKNYYNQQNILDIFNTAKEYDAKKYVKINNTLYKKVYLKNREFFDMNEDVYCLNVPSHSFVCNNIIVHNCMGGELPTLGIAMDEAIANEDYQLAQEYNNKILDFISFCQKVFGKENFYIECAPSSKKDQVQVNNKLYKIASAMDVPMTVATDSHYLKKEDRAIHKAYLTSKEGEREVDDFYEFSRLMDYDECFSLLKDSFATQMPEEKAIEITNTIMENTLKIQSQIEWYSLEHHQTIPEVEVTDYAPSVWWEKSKESIELMLPYPNLRRLFDSENIQERYWINECWKGLEKKIGPWWKHLDYVERLEEEARVKSVISEKLQTCMFAYPNTLQHYINLFWECGSTVGAGRGSACAALNHYLLGITQLDPVEWALPFWR